LTDRNIHAAPIVVTHRLSLRDLLLILAVVTVWGFSFVTIRWALEGGPPFAMAALRFFFAAVPAVLFVKRPPVPWRTLVSYGFAIGVFQFGLLFLGMQLGMPAGLSSLVIQSQVFLTIGLAAWLLHDHVTRHNIVGACIAAGGIAVLAAHKVIEGATATFIGFLIVLAAALSWAVGNIISKQVARRGDVDVVGLVVWASLAVPLPLAIASFAFEGGIEAAKRIAHMPGKSWASVLFMSYCATLFGLGAWSALLHRYPTAVIAPFALLIPVSGLVSAAIFLGESLAALQIAGAALVMAGLAWNLYAGRARDWIARSFD
jgi:O-acetylserine/cysteine efflux transporter